MDTMGKIHESVYFKYPLFGVEAQAKERYLFKQPMFGRVADQRGRILQL